MASDTTLYFAHSGVYTMSDGAQLCEAYKTSLFVPETAEEMNFVTRSVSQWEGTA